MPGGYCTSAFQDLVCALQGLRELDVPEVTITKKVVTHLGELRHLSELGCIDTRNTYLRLFGTSDGQFFSLQVFDFSSPDWFSAGSIMERMACKFTKLYIN